MGCQKIIANFGSSSNWIAWFAWNCKLPKSSRPVLKYITVVYFWSIVISPDFIYWDWKGTLVEKVHFSAGRKTELGYVADLLNISFCNVIAAQSVVTLGRYACFNKLSRHHLFLEFRTTSNINQIYLWPSELVFIIDKSSDNRARSIFSR